MSGRDLSEAAAWVAEGIGYPVECALPSHPMPHALWDALVTHIHADETGRWHGNSLDRDDVESWLADEAGRALAPRGLHPCVGCGLELDGDDLNERCDECLPETARTPEPGTLEYAQWVAERSGDLGHETEEESR